MALVTDALQSPPVFTSVPYILVLHVLKSESLRAEWSPAVCKATMSGVMRRKEAAKTAISLSYVNMLNEKSSVLLHD